MINNLFRIAVVLLLALIAYELHEIGHDIPPSPIYELEQINKAVSAIRDDVRDLKKAEINRPMQPYKPQISDPRN